MCSGHGLLSRVGREGWVPMLFLREAFFPGLYIELRFYEACFFCDDHYHSHLCGFILMNVGFVRKMCECVICKAAYSSVCSCDLPTGN